MNGLVVWSGVLVGLGAASGREIVLSHVIVVWLLAYWRFESLSAHRCLLILMGGACSSQCVKMCRLRSNRRYRVVTPFIADLPGEYILLPTVVRRATAESYFVTNLSAIRWDITL